MKDQLQRACEQLEKLSEKEANEKESRLTMSEFLALQVVLLDLQASGKYELKEVERVDKVEEKLKIIVDENDNVKVYANGVELKGIRKIEFEKEKGQAANVSIDWMTRNLPPFR